MQHELDRRTVIGAAWAAPVVALALAAPGASASPEPPTPVTIDDITLTVRSSELYRTVFDIVVTGSNFGEVVGASFTTTDMAVDDPQGYLQLLSTDSGRAERPLTLDRDPEQGPFTATLTITAGNVSRSFDYGYPA